MKGLVWFGVAIFAMWLYAKSNLDPFPDGRLSRTAVLVRQSDQFFETLLKFRRLHGLAFAIAGYSESKPSGNGIGEAYGSGQES
jgi:hypothetical protein